MIAGILIALLIFVIVVWIIGITPLPESPFPLRSLLYVVAAVLLVLYLIRLV